MLNQLQRVLASFQKHDVKYVVIGGIATILHGVPRSTFDLDILIEPSESNAQRLLAALRDAEIGTSSLTDTKDLLAHEITIFKDYVRIDVQTRTPGVEFHAAWDRKKTVEYNGQSFHILSLDDLIIAKRAAGRAIDLQDADALEALRDSSNRNRQKN